MPFFFQNEKGIYLELKLYGLQFIYFHPLNRTLVGFDFSLNLILDSWIFSFRISQSCTCSHLSCARNLDYLTFFIYPTYNFVTDGLPFLITTFLQFYTPILFSGGGLSGSPLPPSFQSFNALHECSFFVCMPTKRKDRRRDGPPAFFFWCHRNNCREGKVLLSLRCAETG